MKRTIAADFICGYAGNGSCGSGKRRAAGRSRRWIPRGTRALCRSRSIRRIRRASPSGFRALAAAVYRTWEKSGNVKSVDKATVSFSDTEDEDVLLCASLGVVNGVGNGKFAPQQQLTRQQAASMLHSSRAIRARMPRTA